MKYDSLRTYTGLNVKKHLVGLRFSPKLFSLNALNNNMAFKNIRFQTKRWMVRQVFRFS